MGYRIEYGAKIRKKLLKNKPNFRLYALTAGCFLLFVLFAHLVWPDRLATLRVILLPESSAIAVLVESLQEGTPISKAVDVFCQQVIGHGG